MSEHPPTEGIYVVDNIPGHWIVITGSCLWSRIGVRAWAIPVQPSHGRVTRALIYRRTLRPAVAIPGHLRDLIFAAIPTNG